MRSSRYRSTRTSSIADAPRRFRPPPVRRGLPGLHAVVRRSGRAILPGGTVVYTVAGHGEPLLLLHGLGETRRTWDRILDALATTHTVVSIDLPGHGASAAPVGARSPGALAAVAHDLLLELGHGAATVVGHSTGGDVALQFARLYPESTRRLVLIGSGRPGRLPTRLLRAEGRARPRARPAGPAGPAAARQGSSRGGVPRHEPFLGTGVSALAWRGRSLAAARHVRRLVGLPVLAIWGGDDGVVPPRSHRAVVRDLPGVRLVEIGGAGHHPQQTRPERLVAHLTTFLADTPDATIGAPA